MTTKIELTDQGEVQYFLTDKELVQRMEKVEREIRQLRGMIFKKKK